MRMRPGTLLEFGALIAGMSCLLGCPEQSPNTETNLGGQDIVAAVDDTGSPPVTEDTASPDPVDGVGEDTAPPVPIDGGTGEITAPPEPDVLDPDVLDPDVPEPDVLEPDTVGPLVCVGITPPESAWGAEPGPIKPPEDEPGEGDNPEAEPCVDGEGPCVGELHPAFALKDVQPQSCGYQATYGLDAFKGTVTLAVLLASW